MTAIAVALAAALAQGAPASDRFDISADRMDVLRDERRAVITGNVVVLRAEARLTAARMVAFFGENNAGGAQAIERLEADGDVVYESRGQTAKGEQAIYDAVEETITFFGDVSIARDRDVAVGCKLTYDVTTGETAMEPCPEEGGRVRGVFFAEPQASDDPEG